MYPSLTTLLAASDTDALTAAANESQEKWYASAKLAVEGFCHQRFDHEALTLRLDGNGGTQLSLARRLATITSLSTDTGNLDESDVELSPDHDAIRLRSGLFNGGNWVERALREGPVRFVSGDAVLVTGDWGFTDAEMPDTATGPVGLAMLLDMESNALASSHGLRETTVAQSRLGLSDLVEGPLSARMSTPDILLPVEAQLILEPYVWESAPVVA